MAPIIMDDCDFSPLKGAVVVITGGSSGIGLATVKLLLTQGAKVIIGDLQEPPAVICSDRLSFLRTDVTSWTDLKDLFETAVKVFGQVNHVFANAGIAGCENYIEDELDDKGDLKEPTSLVLQINLMGVINTAKLAIHYIKKNNEGGSIVLTASTAAFQRFSSVDYTTAKHGVLGFMRGLASYLHPHIPIRVNSIAPSWTSTGIVPVELCEAAGIPVQAPEVVARSVTLLMADSKRNQQLIYSASGVYTEIEDDLIKAADSIRPKKLSEEDDLQALKAFAYRASGNS